MVAEISRDVFFFPADDREIEQGFPLDGIAVHVPFNMMKADVLAENQLPNQPGKAACVTPFKKGFLDVECQPAIRLQEVDPLKKRWHWNVAKAKRGNTGEGVKAPVHQLLMLSSGEVGEVADQVIVIDVRSITESSVPCFINNIDTNQTGDTMLFELLAHDAIACAQIEHPHFG